MGWKTLVQFTLWFAVASLVWLHYRVAQIHPTGSGESFPLSSSPLQISQQNVNERRDLLSVQNFRDTYNVQDVDALHGLVRRAYCSRDVVAAPASTLKNISTSWIPQRIVQIGRSKVLSSMEEKAQEGVLSWLLKHPCYDYVFLDDAAIEAFFAKMHPRYLRAYNSLVNGGEKADLTRYIFMQAGGGIYADTDTFVVRSAENWNLGEGDSFVVGLEADFISDAVAHEWVYARPRSASLHTFAVSPGNPLLSQVIETVVRNIESPNKIYDEVYSRGIGLPSHLETIFKTGPGPFSDIVLGRAGTGNGGTASHHHTRVLGLWGFSGKHSQGSKFYVEQKRESRADKTVYVEHMNLGSWLKPYPKFKLAGSMHAIRSGTSLVGGEWIAALANDRLLHAYDDADPVRQSALWCHRLGPVTRRTHQGFLHLRKDGILSMGLGKGPRDPDAMVIFSKDPQIKSRGAQVEGSQQPPQKEIFDLHLDHDGVLSLSLLTMPVTSSVQSMNTKHLWSLPDLTTEANGFVRVNVTARKPIHCVGCSLELVFEAYPKSQVCVYPIAP